MSLLSILKTVGKDLGHAGGWIEEGLKVAGPLLGMIDPQLAPIIAAIEAGLSKIPPGTVLNADNIQKFVTATAITHGLSVLPITTTLATSPVTAIPYCCHCWCFNNNNNNNNIPPITTQNKQ